MNFDADDELIGEEALEFLYNQTVSTKADIISFDIINKIKFDFIFIIITKKFLLF
jgi:hypothetical protein